MENQTDDSNVVLYFELLNPTFLRTLTNDLKLTEGEFYFKKDGRMVLIIERKISDPNRIFVYTVSSSFNGLCQKLTYLKEVQQEEVCPPLLPSED